MTNKNVPKLRFPEFLESWTTQKIENIAKINDGTHTTPNYVDSGIKFISVENIEDFSKSNKFIEKEAYQKYKVKSKKNDIFLTRIGTIGESNILTEDETYAYYVSLALIRCNNEINPFYLNQYIKSEFFQRELWNKTLHNAVPKKINLNDLEQCLISFPRLLDEQNKIACFLFDIDKKIELLKDKKEGFIEFKHYLLQNLFPQNGSCVPKLRFNQFADELKSYTLKDLFNSKTGDGQFECILYGELFTTYDEIITTIKSKTDSGDGVLSEYGDILIPISTTTTGSDLVIASVILKDDVKLGSDMTILRKKKKDIIDEIYFAYYFTYILPKEISKYAQGITIVHLAWKYFKNTKITVPSLLEQKTVVNLLINIDNKIDLIEKEIEQLEEYKKGLLQKMFIWRVYLFYCCILSSEYLEIMFYIMIFFLRYVLLTLVSDLMSHIF